MGRAQPTATGLSIADYLERERAAAFKSEYYRGEVFAMAGANYRHGMILSNIWEALAPCLRKRGCRAFANDLRVHIPITSLFTYPDLVVHCGPPVFFDTRLDTLLNPSAIVEVLSPSTADYDRGTKFMLYRSIDSLSEYVLVDQDQRRVERWVKRETWQLVPDAEPLSIGGCPIDLDTIYAGAFDEPAEAAQVATS